ncbi:MAG TPA: aminoacyl-histidine dipeptidase, partial [Clostridium sp.]|nr:aminoacyl-histidine dipeptidase [Clostridium sp.]
MEDGTLKDVEPAEVFKYFEKISSIPRGSGNEKGISDYLVSFAKKHGLDVIQDDALNVVIKAPGSKGYENSPGIVIQGHMDMVCE